MPKAILPDLQIEVEDVGRTKRVDLQEKNSDGGLVSDSHAGAGQPFVVGLSRTTRSRTGGYNVPTQVS
jgi:hypothetical protein